MVCEGMSSDGLVTETIQPEEKGKSAAVMMEAIG